MTVREWPRQRSQFLRCFFPKKRDILFLEKNNTPFPSAFYSHFPLPNICPSLFSSFLAEIFFVLNIFSTAFLFDPHLQLKTAFLLMTLSIVHFFISFFLIFHFGTLCTILVSIFVDLHRYNKNTQTYFHRACKACQFQKLFHTCLFRS